MNYCVRSSFVSLLFLSECVIFFSVNCYISLSAVIIFPFAFGCTVQRFLKRRTFLSFFFFFVTQPDRNDDV